MIRTYLNRPVIRASLWTFGGYGAGQFIRLIGNLVLTRLLFPEAFGLMALVTTFLGGLAMFSDVGTRAAIIQNERGEDPIFLNTAWTIHIVRGFGLWAAACAIAWPVAQVYGQPILFPMLCVAGSTAAINGFQSIAIATANRKLWLGRITLVNIVSRVITTAILVGLAWSYRSVWALVIGNTMGALVGTILGHIALPWHRHAFHIERNALRSLYRFGRWIFLTTIVSYLGGQGVRAIQGALVSVETLGYISVAATFGLLVGNVATQFLGSVAYAKLAMTARERPAEFGRILNRIRGGILASALPTTVALSLVSVPLINLLYDKRYAIAGPYLAIMAINGGIGLLPAAITQALGAQGDTRTPFFLRVIGTTAQIAGIFIGFHLGGVEAMFVGMGVGGVIYYLATSISAYRQNWFSWKTDAPAVLLVSAGACATFLLNF